MKRKTIFSIPYEWYWLNEKWTVSIIGKEAIWTKIYGLQFGSWFLGVIKGEITSTRSPSRGENAP